MARLLGDILIESAACTRSQLHEGLIRAAEIVSGGEYRPIGEILVELGYISREQLEEAIVQQEVEDEAEGPG